MNLLLIRHGQCGVTSVDDVLTEVGERQAQALGERLQHIPLTALLSSPLQRALGTAHIIAQYLDKPEVEVWLELREGLFKAYQGYGSHHLQRHFPLAHLPETMGEQEHSYEADTQENMLRRCQIVLDRLQTRFTADDTIAIVSHGGLITYLLHVLLDIPATSPCWFDLNYAAITHVRLIPQEKQRAYPPVYPAMRVEIVSVNDCSHLM